MFETCAECGRSVGFGSGRFVNRVPILDDLEARRKMGFPYPDEEWICTECDEAFYEEALANGEACANCRMLFGNDTVGLRNHIETCKPASIFSNL